MHLSKSVMNLLIVLWENDLVFCHVLVYVDDIAISSANVGEHLCLPTYEYVALCPQRFYARSC